MKNYIDNIKNYSKLIAIYFITITFTLLLIYTVSGYVLKDTITITPTKTYIKNGVYFVGSKEGVFNCKDDWRFLHFKASNVFNEIPINKKIKVEVTGFRLPIFSKYKNIIKVE